MNFRNFHEERVDYREFSRRNSLLRKIFKKNILGVKLHTTSSSIKLFVPFRGRIFKKTFCIRLNSATERAPLSSFISLIPFLTLGDDLSACASCTTIYVDSGSDSFGSTLETSNPGSDSINPGFNLPMKVKILIRGNTVCAKGWDSRNSHFS